MDSAGSRSGGPGLRALVVDDEPPALSELAFLLARDHVGRKMVRLHAPEGVGVERIR